MMKPLHQLAGLLVFLAICFIVAKIGSMATMPNIESWYKDIPKPSWTPPNWLFGPVWTVLYIAMAVAAWLVWRKTGFAKSAVPMLLFALQLILNAAWSWLFFALHAPGAAFIEIVILWLAILATLVAFWKIIPAAGALMVPYIVWVTFASALNFAVWRLLAAQG